MNADVPLHKQIIVAGFCRRLIIVGADAGTTSGGGISSTTQSAVHAGTAAPVIAVAEVVGATDPSMAHKGVFACRGGGSN